METHPTPSGRRYDLDWLRVLVILVVFIFHASRFFDTYGWHVKNSTTYFGVQVWTSFLASWMMPLIFLISGASLFFALGKGGVGSFLKEKVLRLMVPFLFGIFTHISVAVYLERITHYQFRGTFLQFFPHYFQGLYGDGGNFAWMGLHLWYLLVLFVFTLLMLPLFLLLKGPGRKVLAGLGDLFAKPGLVYLLGLPILWPVLALSPYAPLGDHNWGGWNLPSYLPFFLYGFLIIANQNLQDSLRRWRWLSLALAVAVSIGMLAGGLRYPNPYYGSRGYFLVNAFFGLNAWMWSLTILGFGMQHLTRKTRFLTYANEAVLPFYILHQTVLLCIGYFVTRWQIPDLAKFFTISLSSFLICLAIYEFGVRRSNLMRVLFGMKPRKTAGALQPVPANLLAPE